MPTDFCAENSPFTAQPKSEFHGNQIRQAGKPNLLLLTPFSLFGSGYAGLGGLSVSLRKD